MSDAETRRGFAIRRKFYPLVTVADWRNGDFILARVLTKLSPNEIFGGQADYLSVQMALVAVAISHARPELDEGQIVRFVHELKPDQITEIGFATVDEEDEDGEGDESPPDEDGRAQDSGSAESSDTASETASSPTPTATGDSSTEPGSPTGSPESPPD